MEDTSCCDGYSDRKTPWRNHGMSWPTCASCLRRTISCNQCLAQVCSMLEEDSDETRDASVASSELETTNDADPSTDDKPSTPTPALTKKRRSNFEVRQREELRGLRDEVNALKEQLQSLETDSEAQEKMSFWKRIAQEEKYVKARAVHENQTLREAVDQHATFIDQMKKVFVKKPRISHHQDVHSEEWQAYRLAATASLRHATIHAIADRQIRRMNHAFLRAGLLDCMEVINKAELKIEANGSVM
ncbi:hypothetical protein AC1031_002221 [Aphanomyces cochlioides]|nr:hypothetical protein AC1031_002221 [Aphanomyces cochlioides]